MTTAMIGVASARISSRLRAIASDWPRSSAPRPGYAPGVSIRVMTGRVELLGELHQPERLAVALGVRHAEVALQVLLGVAALLVADHHHRLAVEPRPAADDGGVVAVEPVAVQLDEVGEDGAEVVEGVADAGGGGPPARAAAA